MTGPASWDFARTETGMAQAAPSPSWQLLVAESRTGRVIGRLPLAGLAWRLPLQFGGPSEFRALVPLTETARIRSIVSGPWRFMIVAAYGTEAIAWGYVVAPRPSPGYVEIACADLYALLSRRAVIAVGHRANPQSAAADTTIGPASLPHLARLLLQQATADTAQELPLTIGAPATVGEATRTYLATDLASYGQRLQQLTLDDGGPDITVTPVVSGDQRQVSLRVDIGQPYLGQSGAPWAWSHPGQVVDIEADVDPSAMGDTVYVPGDGIDKDRPIGVATDTTLTGAGFPQMDVVDHRFGSVKDQSTVDSYARAGLSVYGRALEAWRLLVRADAPPVLGSWRRGDTVLLRVEGHYWIPDGSYVRRIVDVAGDHTDLVRVDTAPAPAGL